MDLSPDLRIWLDARRRPGCGTFYVSRTPWLDGYRSSVKMILGTSVMRVSLFAAIVCVPYHRQIGTFLQGQVIIFRRVA